MNIQKDSLPPVKKNTVPKLYRSPKLVEYGDLHEVTRAVGNDPTAMNDGGTGKGSPMKSF